MDLPMSARSSWYLADELGRLQIRIFSEETCRTELLDSLDIHSLKSKHHYASLKADYARVCHAR